MLRGGGRRSRRASVRALALIGGLCALLLAVGGGVFADEWASVGEAKAPKQGAASPGKGPRPAAATGALGLDLLRTLPRGNLVVSPDSVAAALAMTGSGARGRTAAEIARTLHLGRPAAFDSMGSLQRAIVNGQAAAGQGHPKAPTLTIANGLFLQREPPVEPSFLSGLQRHFGAAPEAVDFEGDPSGSVEAINAWVSDKTKGLIPELFESLPRSVQLVLANAIYLEAEWRHPFRRARTRVAPFHNNAGSRRVDFMRRAVRLRYGAGSGYRAVELPYRASRLSLLVLLPRDRKLGALQRQLNAKELALIVRSLSLRRVMLSLPRFQLNTQSTLNATLASLGMPTAFSEVADFSRITGDRSLKIGLVAHAADIKVDEGGTVAAAATGVTLVKKSKPRPPPTVFNANRPFLFFLRDNRTGTILFAGRLTDAASAGF